MKNLILLPLLFLFSITSAQDLEGSWKLVEKDGDPVQAQETIKIYQDGYFAFGTREKGSGEFIKAGGGEYAFDSSYREFFDFHSQIPGLVGTAQEYGFKLSDDRLKIISPEGFEVWERIGKQEDDLSGNWVITGRKQDGEISLSTPGARRTIKILGGGKFQWAAFNSETKEFIASGGGTYTAKDGKYTENIEFFSRNDSRVGAKLDFHYSLMEGSWHHSGKSSRGDPLYEIWSPYKTAYNGGKE